MSTIIGLFLLFLIGFFFAVCGALHFWLSGGSLFFQQIRIMSLIEILIAAVLISAAFILEVLHNILKTLKEKKP